MGALEQVIQLRAQGITDDQIATQLQQQGVPPAQIQNAINQANIKNAVMGTPGGQMQQSITEGAAPQQMSEIPQGGYTPNTQEMPSQQTQYGEEYYPQEGYGNAGYDTGGASYDSQTFVEIAEQAFAEKIKPLQTKLSNLNEFMTLTKVKIENIDERLKRMEKQYDKLQLEILEKVGSYGRNLTGIKNEMDMMQNTMGKVIKKHISHKPAPHKKTHSKK